MKKKKEDNNVQSLTSTIFPKGENISLTSASSQVNGILPTKSVFVGPIVGRLPLGRTLPDSSVEKYFREKGDHNGEITGVKDCLEETTLEMARLHGACTRNVDREWRGWDLRNFASVWFMVSLSVMRDMSHFYSIHVVEKTIYLQIRKRPMFVNYGIYKMNMLPVSANS